MTIVNQAWGSYIPQALMEDINKSWRGGWTCQGEKVMSYRKRHIEVEVKTKLSDRSKAMWEVGQALESGEESWGDGERKKKSGERKKDLSSPGQGK